ncbi:MAG: hypothetical protein IME92_03375 [Proteobacteria bacterium]|nr:hypothetical protein [Pseudomonadota bacterium]
MIIALFGTIFIAIIIGYFSEKTGFTNNGYLNSIIISVGGAVLFILIRVMFGFSFGSHGLNAIISSVGALVIVPTHWRGR